MTVCRDCYVYILFRPWDGSPCYVGTGKGKRCFHTEKTTTNRHLIFIIKKAKRLGLEIPVIKVRENLSDAEALAIEIALIKAIGREKDGGPLVNLTKGGDGLVDPSPEIRARISAKAIERTRTPEWRAAASARAKGRSPSLETRKRIGDAGRGKTRSAETCAAISAALKDKPKSESHSRSLSAARLGVPRGPISETRREAIRKATFAYWERRRQQGLPLRHPRNKAKD